MSFAIANSKMIECPDSGVLLPREFVDQRVALAKVIDDYVDDVTRQFQHLTHTYFLTFHAKFDESDPTNFMVDPPKVTKDLPPFLSNTIVYWICNKRGIKEVLWMVAPKSKGEKLKVEFNKKGVAYLQAKGAMPKVAPRS